jgi:hypothetical protein
MSKKKVDPNNALVWIAVIAGAIALWEDKLKKYFIK